MSSCPDVLMMERALCLAQKGAGRVHPNPMVGAVLARKGRILSEGYHEFFGGPHAEVNALAGLRNIPKDATLYVTLEPCAHFAKTPPCADYLIARGLNRIVIAAKDPNPLVSGRGIARLRKAGIKVIEGVLEEKASKMNKFYNHWIRHQRPYLTVKMVQSLDGKAAVPGGQSRWISGKPARIFTHQLRAKSDAILVGIRTVLKDDPHLTVRYARKTHDPVKIVLDSALRTPADARLFRGPGGDRVIIAASKNASASRRKLLEKKAVILTIREKQKRFLDWEQLLASLGKLGIVSVLVEGGPTVASSVLKARVVQEIYWVMAPLIIGGADSPGTVAGVGPRRLQEALRVKKMDCRFLGKDLLVHGVM